MRKAASDVYLNGGPGPNAAALPSGDYYFQVTDPNGATLLSTDPVSNRRFHVSADGVITQYTGVGGAMHPTGISSDQTSLGAITISLANSTCPADYVTDPNGGTNNHYTGPAGSTTEGTLAICGLVAGAYTVTEEQTDAGGLPYNVVGLAVNGAALPPQPTYSFTWAAGQTAPSVVFENQPPSIF